MRGVFQTECFCPRSAAAESSSNRLLLPPLRRGGEFLKPSAFFAFFPKGIELIHSSSLPVPRRRRVPQTVCFFRIVSKGYRVNPLVIFTPFPRGGEFLEPFAFAPVPPRRRVPQTVCFFRIVSKGYRVNPLVIFTPFRRGG